LYKLLLKAGNPGKTMEVQLCGIYHYLKVSSEDLKKKYKKCKEG